MGMMVVTKPGPKGYIKGWESTSGTWYNFGRQLIDSGNITDRSPSYILWNVDVFEGEAVIDADKVPAIYDELMKVYDIILFESEFYLQQFINLLMCLKHAKEKNIGIEIWF